MNEKISGLKLTIKVRLTKNYFFYMNYFIIFIQEYQ